MPSVLLSSSENKTKRFILLLAKIMLLAIAKTIEKYFVGVLVLGLIFGLLLPNIGVIFEPYMKYLLMLVMFLSFLKIDLDELVDQFVHPAKWVYIVIISMIILPTILYLLTVQLGFSHDIGVAILLVTAMPAAMATPALNDILKGNVPLAIIVLLIGSLLTPFVIPRLMQSLGGVEVSYSFTSMMLLMVFMILVPWIIAQEVKNFFPEFVRDTKQYYTALEIILLFLLVRGPVAKAAPLLPYYADKLLISILWLFAVSIVMHLVAWYCIPHATRQERIAATLSIAYVNLPLAIVFANDFFGPVVAVIVILFDIPWNLMLVPFKVFLDKGFDKEAEALLKQALHEHDTTTKKSAKRTTTKKTTPRKTTKRTTKKTTKRSSKAATA